MAVVFMFIFMGAALLFGVFAVWGWHVVKAKQVRIELQSWEYARLDGESARLEEECEWLAGKMSDSYISHPRNKRPYWRTRAREAVSGDD